MNEIIRPGAGILYMKVGTHAQESLDDIIARKKKEIEDEGFGMWGYGGNTCHPTTMVQPFARSFEEKGGEIFLCMEEMNSKHRAEPIRANQYSTDGVNWIDVPPGIKAVGSRYALLIGSLETVDLELPLNEARVAVGPSKGRIGNKYIQGQVDKACFEIIEPERGANEPLPPSKPIGLTAKLIKPYAVFLRNTD